MPKAFVTYELSEAGRKASLLSGGDGKQNQKLEVEQTDPLFPVLVELGSIDNGGDVRLYIYSYENYFDSPQTVEQIIMHVRARKEAQQLKKEQQEAKRRQATLDVLTQKM